MNTGNLLHFLIKINITFSIFFIQLKVTQFKLIFYIKISKQEHLFYFDISFFVYYSIINKVFIFIYINLSYNF